MGVPDDGGLTVTGAPGCRRYRSTVPSLFLEDVGKIWWQRVENADDGANFAQGVGARAVARVNVPLKNAVVPVHVLYRQAIPLLRSVKGDAGGIERDRPLDD